MSTSKGQESVAKGCSLYHLSKSGQLELRCQVPGSLVVALGFCLVQDAAAQSGGHADYQIDLMALLEFAPGLAEIEFILRRRGEAGGIVDAILIEKYPFHSVPFSQCGLGKPVGSVGGLAGKGSSVYGDGDSLHARNTKPRDNPGLFCCGIESVVATECCEKVQQAQEQVVDRDEQGHGRQHIVALAAMDDGAGLVQDRCAGEQHEACGNGQLQTRNAHEEAQDHGAQQNKEACHQESGQEAEVFAAHQCIAGQAEEDQGCHGQGIKYNVTGASANVCAQDGAQGVAHEAGQGKGENQSHAAVLGFMNGEQQAIEADQGDDQARARQSHAHAEKSHQCGKG